MIKTPETALILIPPAALWPPIQAIRQRHDRHARRWMPHITLVYPFRPADQFETLRAELAKAVQAVEPFVVALETVRSFDHGRGRYTLWLAPEPAAAIDRLQAALQRVVPDCDDVRRHQDGFTPHLTLGQARGRAERDRLLAACQSAWTPLTFAVGHVAFIARGKPPDDVFTVRETLRLGRPRLAER